MTLWPDRMVQRGPGAVTALQLIALALPLMSVFVERGTSVLPVLVTATATAVVWEAVFAVLRKRPVTVHGLTTGLIVAFMVSADTTLWQLSLAMTLGTVIGELIFGGRGFSFLSAAAVSLALLIISFPQTVLAMPGELSALATVPGIVLLLVVGLVPWRVLVATPVALFACLWLCGGAVGPAGIAISLSFGLVFLICDPVASAVTGPGRWVTGALAGVLLFVFNSGETGAVLPAAIVSATVLTSLFAPLVDHVAILANAAMRGRRHG